MATAAGWRREQSLRIAGKMAGYLAATVVGTLGTSSRLRVFLTCDRLIALRRTAQSHRGNEDLHLVRTRGR